MPRVRAVRAGCSLVALSACAPRGAHDGDRAAPVVAITVDDLPAHGALPPGDDRTAMLAAACR